MKIWGLVSNIQTTTFLCVHLARKVGCGIALLLGRDLRRRVAHVKRGQSGTSARGQRQAVLTQPRWWEYTFEQSLWKIV